MKNNKYRILVLSDLKEDVNSILENTVKLSKTIDADVEFFYVKKATDIVDTESQLSAMRTITRACIETEKQIKNLITPISKENGKDIKMTFAFGNVKNEIAKCITTSQPDIIVLGERKPKMVNFLGDNITNFVHKKHTGVVLNASEIDSFNFDKEMSLHFLNKERELVEL